MRMNLLLVTLLTTSTLATVGTSNIAQDPSKTYQTTAGFATHYANGSSSCPGLTDLMDSNGMFFSINGIVTSPSKPDFVSNFCGKCIAIKTKSGRIMSPVHLIDSCAEGCYFSDPGHLNILSNNNNALYKAIEEGADRNQGCPLFTWWWLPSCHEPKTSFLAAKAPRGPRSWSPTPRAPTPVPRSWSPTPTPRAPTPVPRSWSPTPTPSSSWPVPVPVSAPTGGSCPDNQCLSKWGWCGTTDEYCGDGCQSGPCKGGSSPAPTPRSPSPAPRSPIPVPQPVAAPTSSGNTGCGEWKIGTMSGYDNLDGADDMHPGCLAEYCGTNDNFLNNVPVVSVLQRDFNTYKYHNIEINWNGKIGTVQVWDMCVNADCPDGGQCCTNNAVAYGGDFLLDVDRHPLKNLFGITSYSNVLDKVQYRICNYVDPKPLASKWLVGGRETTEPENTGSTVPGWAWGLIGAAIACAVLGLIALAVFMKKRAATERV